MPRISARVFLDPDQLAEAHRGGNGRYKVVGKGAFRAELAVLEIEPLTLQCASESLPRVAYHGMAPGRVGILGWLGQDPLPVVRGAQIRVGEIMSLGRDMESYHRTRASVDYAALLIDPGALSRAAVDLVGCELRIESGTILRPSPRAHARFGSLAASVRRAARETPDVFRSESASRALGHSLTHAMIGCLVGDTPRREMKAPRERIMARFEVAVEAHANRPLHLAELCRLVGVPERTLRKACQQHLGMGPHQYLVRRRLHLARRALLFADPGTATVTDVATHHGFWELGRFAVRYRSIFGEAPSETLRRPSDGSRTMPRAARERERLSG